MGIMSLISREKEKFKAQRTFKAPNNEEYGRKNEAQIQAEKLQQLRAETVKAEGMAKLKQEEIQLRDRLQKAKGPSKAQRFGKGLAMVMNKAKTGIQAHKAQVAKRGGGLSIGAPQSYGSRGLDTSSRNVFGGASRDVFSGGPEPKKKAAPSVKVIVKQ